MAPWAATAARAPPGPVRAAHRAPRLRGRRSPRQARDSGTARLRTRSAARATGVAPAWRVQIVGRHVLVGQRHGRWAPAALTRCEHRPGSAAGQPPRGPNNGTSSGLGQPPRGASAARGSGRPLRHPAAPRRDRARAAPVRSGGARGATLQATTASTRLPKQTITNPRLRRQTADAEAARSEIDEFEEAVLRAERESAQQPRYRLLVGPVQGAVPTSLAIPDSSNSIHLRKA